ncbi:U32 family peptidase [Clostridium oryzae]|nr:U32 family peptidase [Clostridium oryzae]
MESLYAAICNGADAVYLGGNKFSARAYAENFNLDNIKEAVNYCHIYGKKLYVTFNTLIKEKEFSEAMDYVSGLYDAGVDALIVQDIGIAAAIHKDFKNFELHASTQMSIHNQSGCEMLMAAGFKRIVLARELAIEEIKKLSAVVDTEIFIHGALCVCYSGQCLMSSMIGGRSGNRGRCAQSCRMPYTLINSDNGENRRGYLLSTKDIATLDNIDKVVESGTKSLKIEGRMKRPEYVAGIVRSYRKALDSYYSGNWPCNLDKEKKILFQLFNREGFSSGYIFGNHGKEMMAYENPKNSGIKIGKVDSNGDIRLEDNIAVKDGFSIGENGAFINKIIYKGNEVQHAGKNQTVKLYPNFNKKGADVYKTSDNQLNEELRETFKDKYSKKIKLDVQIQFSVGSKLALYTVYNGIKYEYKGEIVEKAIHKPVTQQFIIEKIQKTGNTPFEIENIDFLSYDEGFMAAAAINDSRRMLLEQVKNGILSSYSRKVDEYKSKVNSAVLEGEKPVVCHMPQYMFTVVGKDQLKALEELNIETVALDLYKRKLYDINLQEVSIPNIYIKLPPIIRNEFSTIIAFIEKNAHNIKGIITSNYGILQYFKNKLCCIGDYKLNIFNSEAQEFIRDYCGAAALSVELNRSDIKQIIEKNRNNKFNNMVLIYGKIELMVSEYCAVGSVLGGNTIKKSCNEKCMGGNYVLKDRMDKEFVLKQDIFCRSYIYNSVPINLTENISELGKLGIRGFRVDFIDEDYNRTYDIAKSIIEKKAIEDGEFTRGHYKRGVE